MGSPWAFASSPTGDFLVVLPRSFKVLSDLRIVTGGKDGMFRVVGVSSTKDRKPIELPLARIEGQESLEALRSVIVARPDRLIGVDMSIALVGKKVPGSVVLAEGKPFPVRLDRVADEGIVSGVWRGFVDTGSGRANVFAELTPPFSITPGSEFRIVGSLVVMGVGVDPNPVVRFGKGSWIPLEDRVDLFSSGAVCHAAFSGTSGGDEDAVSAFAEVMAFLSHDRAARRRTEVVQPITTIPFGQRSSPAQEALRTRFMTGNERTVPIRGRMPDTARRSPMVSTEWHGEVRPNGEVLLEIRSEGPARNPVSSAVIISSEPVVTSDGMPSRIGVRMVYDDGSKTLLLLGGGPQKIAGEISAREDVLIVQGKPGAKNYSEVAVFVAKVERR